MIPLALCFKSMIFNAVSVKALCVICKKDLAPVLSVQIVKPCHLWCQSMRSLYLENLFSREDVNVLKVTIKYLSLKFAVSCCSTLHKTCRQSVCMFIVSSVNHILLLYAYMLCSLGLYYVCPAGRGRSASVWSKLFGQCL